MLQVTSLIGLETFWICGTILTFYQDALQKLRCGTADVILRRSLFHSVRAKKVENILDLRIIFRPQDKETSDINSVAKPWTV